MIRTVVRKAGESAIPRVLWSLTETSKRYKITRHRDVVAFTDSLLRNDFSLTYPGQCKVLPLSVDRVRQSDGSCCVATDHLEEAPRFPLPGMSMLPPFLSLATSPGSSSLRIWNPQHSNRKLSGQHHHSLECGDHQSGNRLITSQVSECDETSDGVLSLEASFVVEPRFQSVSAVPSGRRPESIEAWAQGIADCSLSSGSTHELVSEGNERAPSDANRSDSTIRPGGFQEPVSGSLVSFRRASLFQVLSSEPSFRETDLWGMPDSVCHEQSGRRTRAIRSEPVWRKRAGWSFGAPSHHARTMLHLSRPRDTRQMRRYLASRRSRSRLPA